MSSLSSSLPPGCRFYPSEEELLCYYLFRKNNNDNNPPLPSSSAPSNLHFYETIKEIKLYNFNPFELPELACFRFGYRGKKRHWYCYTESINGEERESRKAGFGFWRRKGRVRDVMGNGGQVILGKRKCFIFYLEKCNGRSSKKTNWVMYEYALLDNVKASFVICRVFVKSCGRNSISEHALSSCAEESVATVRHMGIQHDGSTLSILNEDKVHCCDYVNKRIAGEPRQLIEQTLPKNQGSPRLAGSTNMSVDSLTANHLVSILEGDFIELDDLV